MTEIVRLPSPNGSRHPSVRSFDNLARRKRLVLTDRARRLGVVLLAGGTGSALGITFTASVYPHPGALVCAVLALVGSVLYVGGGN